MAITTIESIQFKRGSKAALEAKLINDNKLLFGEPAWEIDTNRIKVGDGTKNYAELSYLACDAGEDTRFLITSPTGNQLLFYDETSKKWINKALSAEESIIYMDELSGTLKLKGFDSASQGQMLVKDNNVGLTWIDPLSTAQLDAAVAAASASASTAGEYATTAGNKAAEAQTAAGTATRINQQTMAWVNNKFWWGSLEEYNALESISPGTFYFVRAEV